MQFKNVFKKMKNLPFNDLGQCECNGINIWQCLVSVGFDSLQIYFYFYFGPFFILFLFFFGNIKVAIVVACNGINIWQCLVSVGFDSSQIYFYFYFVFPYLSISLLVWHMIIILGGVIFNSLHTTHPLHFDL